MDDGTSSPNSVFGSFSANNLDYDPMDELLYDGYWLESTEESNFSSLGVSNMEPDMGGFNPNLRQKNFVEGLDRSSFDDNPLSDHSQMIDFGENQSRNREVILANTYSDQSENFLVVNTEPTKRLWIAPAANPSPNLSVKDRLIRAIEYLGKLTKDSDVLVQIWVPIRKEGKQILTTDDQPFSYSPNSMSLANYRNVSEKYHFAAEENSKDFTGLPGRVFLKKLPEWTPDVRLFKVEEYPRVNYAQMCNVSGSLALPVFERESGNCLGVVEIVTTNLIINHRPELENVCKALEAVDLRSSEISGPQITKGSDDSYQYVITEIQQILKSVCDAHGLPLAQTWTSCVQLGKTECTHSNKDRSFCIATINSACYVRDERVSPFHKACSEHYLLLGEGIVGEAFTTNQPCFANDVTAFSKTEYPLSHYAKIFNLRGSVAVRVRSIYTGSAEFVLEFFLPSECNNVKEQWHLLGSLSTGIQHVCRSLRLLTDDEVDIANISPPSKLNAEENPKFDTSINAHIESEGQGKGEIVDSSVEYRKKGLVFFGENSRLDDEQICHDFGSKGHGESGREFYSGAGKKPGEKRQAKSEKNISLQVLRQYFAGSLKDAAKSLGVCPTTLKRICRQHGITRWPSRKIKKVGHSLRKLQLVINSVQGVEGPIQLDSFYSNFPKLTSTSILNSSSAPQLDDLSMPPSTEPEANVLSPEAVTSKSSGSQSSSSSFSTGKPPPMATSLVEQPNGGMHAALDDIELHEPGQAETELLVRSQSQNISSEIPIPLPNRSGHISKEGSGFRVKATFGEENVRFALPNNWTFGDVKNEILKRFHINENGKTDLKYLDDDSEWVLLTCDADLEECLDIHRSTRCRTIKITVHQGFVSNPYGSFGSSRLSE